MIHISIIFIFLINYSTAFELNCNFTSNYFYGSIHDDYTCTPYNLHVTREDNIVTKVNGIHTHGKTNSDVKKLLIKFQNCEYFPRGLGNFFPNLQSINIQKSNLQILIPGDLDGLNKLKIFNVEQNSVHEIGADFFKEHETIETVSFRGCHLRKVESGALSMLKNLKDADFTMNKCITTKIDAFRYRNALSGALADLYDKCNGRGFTIRKHNPPICKDFVIETKIPLWMKFSFVLIVLMIITSGFMGFSLFRIYNKKHNGHWNEMTFSVITNEENCS